MKGFMTVRKWIDRSIAGLETRSGDYPITNTKYVAIIVMLTGLENIPRITELKEIREQYIAGRKRQAQREAGIIPSAGQQISGTDGLPAGVSSSGSGRSVRRDEMIVLPGETCRRTTLLQQVTRIIIVIRTNYPEACSIRAR